MASDQNASAGGWSGRRSQVRVRPHRGDRHGNLLRIGPRSNSETRSRALTWLHRRAVTIEFVKRVRRERAPGFEEQ
jgi:hypothetical protein